MASALSWIEGDSIRQLERLLDRIGADRAVGLPDLHPGHKGPVGCAFQTIGTLHPDIVGTDIGCGMAFWLIDAEKRRLKLDRCENDLRRMSDDFCLSEFISDDVFSSDLARTHLGSLGTVGSGNHFVELQFVAEILDEDRASAIGLKGGQVGLLVHSGSRSMGADVFARHFDGEHGLPMDGERAISYMRHHDGAVHFAAMNRRVLGLRAMDLLKMEGTMVSDTCHNSIEVRNDRAIHRKGASPSNMGMVAIAGSRGASSYLVHPSTDHGETWLHSIAHGAGRKKDRRTMVETARSKKADAMFRSRMEGRVICDDKRLRIEEAPSAYKDIDRVVADMVLHGAAIPIARMEPLVTFKTTGDRSDD